MSFDARLLRFTIVIWLTVGIFMAVPMVLGGPSQVYTPFNEVCSAVGLSGVPLYEDSFRGWLTRQTSSLCRMKLKTRTDQEVLVVLTSYEVGWTVFVLLAFVIIRQVPRIFRW
jgi:hypothetical protein